jgi:hypothetical protein
MGIAAAMGRASLHRSLGWGTARQLSPGLLGLGAMSLWLLSPWLLSSGLFSSPAAAEAQLSLERSRASFPNGDPIWQLRLIDGPKLVRSWQAASGAANRQRLDRRWTQGNGAPLPPGSYRLGKPEPWGHDLWIELQPQFATSRSGLGLHHCMPGVGCICLPNRQDLKEASATIQRLGIRRLQVLN